MDLDQDGTGGGDRVSIYIYNNREKVGKVNNEEQVLELYIKL